MMIDYLENVIRKARVAAGKSPEPSAEELAENEKLRIRQQAEFTAKLEKEEVIAQSERKDFGELLGIFVPCTVAHPIRLSQLSERSWGAGIDSRGKTHIQLLDAYSGKRIKRQKGDFLCKKKSTRHFDIDDMGPKAELTCPKCQDRLNRI